ncbi:hypothetical protein YC2023_059052 [Brassica napus]
MRLWTLYQSVNLKNLIFLFTRTLTTLTYSAWKLSRMKTLKKPSSSRKQKRINNYFPRTGSTRNSNDQVFQMLTKVSTQVSKLRKENKVLRQLIKRRKSRTHSKRSAFHSLIYNTEDVRLTQWSKLQMFHLTKRYNLLISFKFTKNIFSLLVSATNCKDRHLWRKTSLNATPPSSANMQLSTTAKIQATQIRYTSLHYPNTHPLSTTPLRTPLPFTNPLNTPPPVHNSHENTSPVHKSPEHTPPIHSSPVHNSPENTSPVHRSPEHTPPVHSSPVPNSPQHTSPVHNSPKQTTTVHNSPQHTPSVPPGSKLIAHVRTSPLPASPSGTPPWLYNPESLPVIYRSYIYDAADHPNSPPCTTSLTKPFSQEPSSLNNPRYYTSTRKDPQQQLNSITPETSPTKSSGFAEHADSVNAFAATATSKRTSAPILNFDQNQVEIDCRLTPPRLGPLQGISHQMRNATSQHNSRNALLYQPLHSWFRSHRLSGSSSSRLLSKIFKCKGLDQSKPPLLNRSSIYVPNDKLKTYLSIRVKTLKTISASLLSTSSSE